jgi:hypothetical protein
MSSELASDLAASAFYIAVLALPVAVIVRARLDHRGVTVAEAPCAMTVPTTLWYLGVVWRVVSPSWLAPYWWIVSLYYIGGAIWSVMSALRWGVRSDRLTNASMWFACMYFIVFALVHTVGMLLYTPI